MICFIAFCAMTLSLIVNIALGLPVNMQIANAVLLLLLVLFYYQSRFRKRFKLSRIVFTICCYGILPFNFFYNSGSYGPTILGFFLTYIFLIAIFNRKTYLYWIALHFITGVALMIIEHYYPNLVPYTYADTTSRYVDITTTYAFILIFSYCTYNFIRANYDFERLIASNRAVAIETHNRELAKVNEEKNKLFSIVSHDLRSPLNTIQSYLELLSYGVLDEAEKVEAQSQLLSLTKNTSDLLFNLLSWSKTQMEGVNAKLQRHNLFDVLASTINTQHAIASKKNISFSNQIDKQATITCDEDMLQLVARNLLNNAIKFTPSFGEITISSSIRGDKTYLIIKDTGRGIPPEQQKEIFSLKINSTYGTQNEKGIGLGLLLCKEYMELQHGGILFESETGKGTTFFVSLPA
jgi:two-component system sensor histidine kinase/response regulator